MGWVDWNMVLNNNGGPNHVGNFYGAPVIVDNQSNEVLYESPFYYLGHFSKFIRPGAKRVNAISDIEGLEYTAFINTDRNISLVIMNSRDNNKQLQIKDREKYMKLEIPAHLIITLVYQA